MRRFACGLAVFALANLLLLNLGLPRLLGSAQGKTAWADTARLLAAPRVYKHDSFHPMNAAVLCRKFLPDMPLYDLLFFGLKTKFQYPPTSLLVMYPIVLPGVGITLGRWGMDWYAVLATFSWVLVFVTAACGADVLRRELGATGRPAAMLFIIGAALSLTYYPVVHGFTLGQVQVWVNALFAAAVWCWVTNRRAGAGVAVALMCLLKPQYGILLVWGLLRRQWSFMMAAAATAAVGCTTSVALFGLDNHLGYLHVLTYIARHGESYYPNQSINGLLNRLLHNGPNLQWDGSSFAPFHPLVYGCTLASSLALLGPALFGRLPQTRRGTVLDLGATAAAATLASPVAWDHHYGVLLPVYAVLVGTLRRVGAGRRAWLALAVSFALTANLFLFTNRTAATPLNFVQSYMLFGGLLAQALLLRFRARAGQLAPLKLSPGTEPSPKPGLYSRRAA